MTKKKSTPKKRAKRKSAKRQQKFDVTVSGPILTNAERAAIMDDLLNLKGTFPHDGEMTPMTSAAMKALCAVPGPPKPKWWQFWKQ